MFDPKRLLEQVMGGGGAAGGLGGIGAAGGLGGIGSQVKSRLDSLGGAGGFASGAAVGGFSKRSQIGAYVPQPSISLKTWRATCSKCDGATRLALMRRCCSTRDRPRKAAAAIFTRKWLSPSGLAPAWPSC